jgi:capsular exopolysaccharide synthesis family protein
MSPDEPMRSVVVSSAEESAGKTASAVKMATLISQTEGRVLIVDADMRRPRLHKAFGVPNETGLSALISGTCALEDAVKQTEIPGVEVLTSGRMPPNPAELLHSKRFAELCQELEQRYAFVVFDSPPLLHVTDAMILGKASDGIILIARQGKTTRQALARCGEQLRDVHVKVFGVILNDVDLDRRGAYYYSAGRYLRHYYASQD